MCCRQFDPRNPTNKRPVRWLNPKQTHPHLGFNDLVQIEPIIKLPDEVRYSDLATEEDDECTSTS